MMPARRWHPKVWFTHYAGPQTVLTPAFDDDDGYLACVVAEIRSKGSFISGQTYRSAPYGPHRASIEQLAWECMQADRRRLLHEQADREWGAGAP